MTNQKRLDLSWPPPDRSSVSLPLEPERSSISLPPLEEEQEDVWPDADAPVPETPASGRVVVGSLFVLSGLFAGAFMWLYADVHPGALAGLTFHTSDRSLAGVTEMQPSHAAPAAPLLTPPDVDAGLEAGPPVPASGAARLAWAPSHAGEIALTPSARDPSRASPHPHLSNVHVRHAPVRSASPSGSQPGAGAPVWPDDSVAPPTVVREEEPRRAADSSQGSTSPTLAPDDLFEGRK